MGALDGMAALVTGGAGGIGGASARWLLRDGCSVTLMGRTESSLQEQAAELETEARRRARPCSTSWATPTSSTTCAARSSWRPSPPAG